MKRYAAVVGRHRPDRPERATAADDETWALQRIALATMDVSAHDIRLLDRFSAEVAARSLGLQGWDSGGPSNTKLAKDLQANWEDKPGKRRVQALDDDELVEEAYQFVKFAIRQGLLVKGLGLTTLAAGTMGAVDHAASKYNGTTSAFDTFGTWLTTPAAPQRPMYAGQVHGQQSRTAKKPAKKRAAAASRKRKRGPAASRGGTRR